MIWPLWFTELLKKAFPHRFYFFAPLSKIPGIGRIIDYVFFKEDIAIYLPKDRVININQKITDGVKNVVFPSDVIKHFIEKTDYHWIMNFCLCRSSMTCKNYPIDLGCIFLGEAILKIDSRLGRRVSKEEALAHLRRGQKAGLIHMLGRGRLDELWLTMGEGDKLLSICHCCPCCCLWKMYPYLDKRITSKVTRMPTVTVKVKETICIGCGLCKTVCFISAIRITEGKAFITDDCLGCGLCVQKCPRKAIELSINLKQAIPESITQIDNLVDVS